MILGNRKENRRSQSFVVKLFYDKFIQSGVCNVYKQITKKKKKKKKTYASIAEPNLTTVFFDLGQLSLQ